MADQIERRLRKIEQGLRIGKKKTVAVLDSPENREKHANSKTVVVWMTAAEMQL